MFYWKVSRKITGMGTKKKAQEFLEDVIQKKETFDGELTPVCCDTGTRNAVKKVAQGWHNARRWLVSKLGAGTGLTRDDDELKAAKTKVIINKCKVWGDEYQPVDTDYLFTPLSSPDDPEPPKDEEPAQSPKS